MSLKNLVNQALGGKRTSSHDIDAVEGTRTMIQERVASPDLMSEHASTHVGPDSSPPCHKSGIIVGPCLNVTIGHEHDYTIHQIST